MGILNQLNHLSDAEEFFTVLDVEFDPKVLNVARLHILRRMGDYLKRDHQQELSGLSEEDVRDRCRAHLQTAYADFVASNPIAERVFKVHRDAVKPAPTKGRSFIPLSVLTGRDDEPEAAATDSALDSRAQIEPIQEGERS